MDVGTNPPIWFINGLPEAVTVRTLDKPWSAIGKYEELHAGEEFHKGFNTQQLCDWKAVYPMLYELIDGCMRGPLFHDGMYGCDCSLCTNHLRAATSGKVHFLCTGWSLSSYTVLGNRSTLR